MGSFSQHSQAFKINLKPLLILTFDVSSYFARNIVLTRNYINLKSLTLVLLKCANSNHSCNVIIDGKHRTEKIIEAKTYKINSKYYKIILQCNLIIILPTIFILFEFQYYFHILDLLTFPSMQLTPNFLLHYNRNMINSSIEWVF